MNQIIQFSRNVLENPKEKLILKTAQQTAAAGYPFFPESGKRDGMRAGFKRSGTALNI